MIPSATSPQDSEQRPLAFEEGNFLWNIQRVPHLLPDGKTRHPGRSSAIFVVHGMGQQLWTETAAQLRAGFEDAFEDIVAWQKKYNTPSAGIRDITLPPPFIFDGYWANYDDIQMTFAEDWKHFNEREQKFFGNLWKQRIVSGARTIRWVFGKQMRLLHPKVLCEVGLLPWILYWPLQIVAGAALLFAWFRFLKAITGFANDVRLYLEPRGIVERAIVQRIDYRVGEAFLRMIGLDWDFRPLPSCQLIEAGEERLTFDRVVWVAHSLGTVISYNTLSALFHKAEQIELSSTDAKQKEGVIKFRQALCRFVTMGSPLDKVAFLFKHSSLRPWPADARRRALLLGGETVTSKDPGETEWWINFYHVLDPVSGALENPFICGKQVPSNIHIRSGWIPGLAHIAYWNDPTTLRFILGRTFGTTFLRDKEYRPWPSWVLTALAAMSYFVWAMILFGAVYTLYRWGPALLRGVGQAALQWITG